MSKEYFNSENKAREVANKIWDDFIGFSEYSFPRGHATAYGIIANATQFLKVKYPTEFFTAFLQQATDDEYESIKGVSKKNYDVKYIMPEINLSKEKFVIANNKIVWSFASIKGIGSKAATEIVDKQPFKSFEDFYNRITKRTINVRVMKLLITANIFRKFGKRNEIVTIFNKLRGNNDLEELSKAEWELEASSIMPFARKSLADIFPEKLENVMSHDEFLNLKTGRRAIVAGTITAIRTVKSKRGMMVIMKVGDSGEIFNVICWNDFYKKLVNKGIKLVTGMPVKVSGTKGVSYMDEEQLTLGAESTSYIKVLK